MHSNRQVALGSSGGLAGLAFIGRALKIRDAGKNDAESQRPSEESHSRGEITDEHGCAAADGAEQIQCEDGAAVAQPEIRKAVSRVVLPGRGKGQQAAPRAGNGYQRRVENSRAVLDQVPWRFLPRLRVKPQPSSGCRMEPLAETNTFG